MKNFIQTGDAVTLTAPATVASGAPVQIGSLIGVATGDAATGEPVTIATRGVFALPKTSTDAVTVGAVLYFDSVAGEVTVADGSGANLRIGHAVTAAGNPSATVHVRLSV